MRKGILLVADRHHRAPIAFDLLHGTRTSAGALPPRPGRQLAVIDAEVRDSWPPIPRHTTFEVSGGLVGTIECRCGGKVARFRFYSRSSGLLFLRILAERGAISTSEEQALATRTQLCSLPEWAGRDIERGPTFGATFENLHKTGDATSQGFLLQRGEVIKEQQEWMV
jgi:hypothetical protein